ncbi:hypothetical protein GH714_041342 [Hevea brasiliensis]|uniref:Pentatricopeptide repeat-containing protein n=1 Tax=Hevea brasiliensis TaxID=3981 RepID=A0A6A6MZI3_HEVBR|nr:hypothetical protein GH714_041342 [Hevea brasiliensis]
MIRGFSKTSEPLKAFDYYKRMQGKGLVADNFTFSSLLKACGQVGSVLLAEQMHCSTLKHGLESHLFVRNALIHMYGMFKYIETSRQLFEEIPSPELVAWNTIIGCYVYCGRCREALDMFSRMLKFGIEPDEATLVETLAACSALGALDFGKWVHSCISNTGLGSILEPWRDGGRRKKFFGIMSKEYLIQPTIKHYGCMVDILGRAGFVEEAYGLVRSMPMECNAIVWRTLLAACRLHGNVELGKQVRRHLLQLEPNHSSDYVLLSNMYASVGQWNEVMKVRKSMLNTGVRNLSLAIASFVCILAGVRIKFLTCHCKHEILSSCNHNP